RRRLHLRRRDRPAGEHRGQARRGARQAAPARARRPVRPADRDQQCAVAGLGAGHPRQGAAVLPGLRHGPLARHLAGATGRQYQERRPDRTGVRRHAARDLVRLRRRQRQRPSDQGGAGGRPAGRLPAAVA
ncbi:hypothetical protein LTR94_033877, partial [Friedmanniomyces endolithicus]